MAKISSYKLESLIAGLWFKRESLVSWLNSNRASKAQCTRLIEALHERNTLAENGDKSEEGRRRGYDLHLEILKLTRPLRRTWWDLAPSPEMSDGLDNVRHWHLEQRPPDQDRMVLGMVASLSEYGLLDSVRKCQNRACGKWFLAYTGKSKNCSPECKKSWAAAQRKTPEGRKERADYMRKLRDAKKRIKPRKASKR